MDHRFIGNLVGAAILFFAVILGWFWVDRRDGVFLDYASENKAFAETFFADLFPYEAVLASQKWHARGAESWDCTYAVVSISAGSPSNSGRRSRSVLGWQYAWGGDWIATPAVPLGDNTRDAVGFCTTRLPDGLGQRIQDVMNSTGGYYARDRVGETVYLYAPEQGLAARIRYGD